MESKEAVRQACKSKRAALSVAECERWSRLLTEEIIKLPEYEAAQSVMAYLAMPKEANLDGVIAHALQHGKRVYVPVCVDATTMVPAGLSSLDEVESGVLGIRIPKQPYEDIEPANLDLILVPGAGFDRYGGRMGMGNGYYDRFLVGLSPDRCIGVCWDAQIVHTRIPMGDYDRYMNQIVTECGVIHCDRVI